MSTNSSILENIKTNSLGAYLKQKRKEIGLRPKDLDKRINDKFGYNSRVSASYIQEIEGGRKSNPSFKTLDTLADGLGLNKYVLYEKWLSDRCPDFINYLKNNPQAQYPNLRTFILSKIEDKNKDVIKNEIIKYELGILEKTLIASLYNYLISFNTYYQNNRKTISARLKKIKENKLDLDKPNLLHIFELFNNERNNSELYKFFCWLLIGKEIIEAIKMAKKEIKREGLLKSESIVYKITLTNYIISNYPQFLTHHKDLKISFFEDKMLSRYVLFNIIPHASTFTFSFMVSWSFKTLFTLDNLIKDKRLLSNTEDLEKISNYITFVRDIVDTQMLEQVQLNLNLAKKLLYFIYDISAQNYIREGFFKMLNLSQEEIIKIESITSDMDDIKYNESI